MSDKRVIVEHKDGRRYSVTRADAAKHYPDFKIVGDETPEAFVATGIPKPKRRRSKPKAKAAAPIAAPTEPEA